MHAEPEIFQIELREVVAIDGIRIEIVFLEAATLLRAALLIFAPEKTHCVESARHNDRSDHIDGKLALQGFNHTG